MVGDEVMGPVAMAEVALVVTVLAEVEERLLEISLLDRIVVSLVVVESGMEVAWSVPSDVVTDVMTEEISVPV